MTFKLFIPSFRGFIKTRMFLLREAKRAKFSNLRVLDLAEEARVSREGDESDKESPDTSSYWAPDPRTGIYVPKGHEHVVNDVPTNSATFDRTYWLRGVDGVDKADHDLPTDHYFNTITCL